MASQAPRFVLSVLCLIFATEITLASTGHSLSEVLSLLHKGHNRRPVLLVVDSKSPLHSQHHSVTHSSSEEDLTRSGLMKLMRHLAQPRPKSQANHLNRGHFKSKVNNLLRERHDSDVPSSSSSNIIKDLLVLRNSLRCKQQYDCKSECMEKPKYKKNVCDNKCEENYECEDEPEDDCAVDDDTCSIDDNPSTRGLADTVFYD